MVDVRILTRYLFIFKNWQKNVNHIWTLSWNSENVPLCRTGYDLLCRNINWHFWSIFITLYLAICLF